MMYRHIEELTLREINHLARLSSRKRRQIMRARRRWHKLLNRIEHDMVAIYPNQPAYDIVARLSNQDLGWQGDFDLIRPELSQLLDRLLQLGALPEETSRVLVALDFMSKRGSIIDK
jgi:hypothetical protein